MAGSATRLVFIPTGKSPANQDYGKLTKTQLESITEATGFVLTPTSAYSIYKTDYTNYISALRAQMKEVPKAKLFYIGLPVINASDSYKYSATDYNRLRTFIKDMSTECSQDYPNFTGFYFTNERVFGTVSANDPMSNGMVKLMNDLAYSIRNDPNLKIYKEFIWAPYLGRNYTYYTINQNLGLVVNRTNIFNTVYLQSGHFFTPQTGKWNSSTRMGQPAQNLALSYKCAEKNAVYNYTANDDKFIISNTPVGGSKTSSTKVGIDMEASDALGWNDPEYTKYYQEECDEYKSLIVNGTCPFVFFAGAYSGIITKGLYRYINSFYKNGGSQPI